ncbi:MAG: Flp pilus assembly protein CpaB [Cellulomonas sp. 73-145]|uniref:Flp pilus assembly protein CpaB n=1 Tax=Cellulomonas sp. 73-145 TaxID=1895739 RepID=UPI0009285498|nr:Flp pilus assembly protein CpaB [Cellulomonas sp. 73-145]OJV58708.1 MAG: Flp pilus assembly protein CpaB [Cellulomonas sp. 73-145]
MNPRQRRGALLLVLTSVGAIVVFFAVVAFVGRVGSEVGPMTTAWELSRDVTAYEPVDGTMLHAVQMPERWLPKTAIRSQSEVQGLVAAANVPAGSVLQKGMLVPRPGVQPGYREVAIVVDAETGVAGKVKPGNHVDIIATTAAGKDGTPQKSEIWVSNALVLEVGVPSDVSKSDAGGSFATTKGVPVTFALTSDDALRLAYVESFSVKLRLALRGDGDDQSVPDSHRTYEGR